MPSCPPPPPNLKREWLIDSEPLLYPEARVAAYGCPLWARKETIRKTLAEAPDNWFLRYMAGEKYGAGWCKMAEGDGGVVLFHAPTVLAAIESEKYKRKYNYAAEPRSK